jgi:hypothetical protein
LRSSVPWRLALPALACVATLAGCELEEVAIPRTESRIALHGILSPTASSQVVMLERTRNGTVFITNPNFDIVDPVVSDAGVAESGAVVVLTTPRGEVVQAQEDLWTRGDGRGAGIYRFPLSGSQLERGGNYHLSVITASGPVLSADATVPEGDAAVAPQLGTFDRASDTVTLEWAPAPGARTYFVRVETPYGPRAFFTDSTRVRLPGLVRNVDAERLPRVFIPGFQQQVTVSAVDSNFYDWVRTSNDVFTGTGVVNRVTGGIGVFGSVLRMRFLDVKVVVPQVEPWAGTYDVRVLPGESPPPNLGLELYLESRAARADQPDAVSGRYTVRPRFEYAGCLTCGLLGSVRGNRVTLAFVRDWSAQDTVDVLVGEVRGDTIIGTYRGFGGIARFVKRPAASATRLSGRAARTTPFRP